MNLLQQLQVGQSYERNQIATLLGYENFRAIAKGVVTPANSKLIILFVTKEKQQSLTQYNDYIDGSFLFWEGEERHGSDIRIKRAADNSDQIVLFYRNRHHATFIFMGEIFLLEEVMHTTKPSEFIFSLLPAHASSGSVIYETIDPNSHEFLSLHETDREQLTKARIGQNNFRKNLIKMWGKCSVTGVENLEFLNASHIKPWRVSSNEDRLNPYNGLLLAPALDTAFDKGYIGFDPTGKIIISGNLAREDAEKMAINENLRLLKRPTGNLQFLTWHLENYFDKKAA